METHLHLGVCVILLICTRTLLSGSVDAAVVDATVGEDSDLLCSGPVGEVLVLEWTYSRQHLLFYRDGKVHPRHQLKQFRGRVQLKDPEMENGTMSVTLKGVKTEDNGTYLCEGLVQTPEGKRESFKRSVELRVSEKTPGNTPVHEDEADVNIWPVTLGVIGAVVFISAGAAVLIWKTNLIQKLKKSDTSPKPSTPSPQSTLDSSDLLLPPSPV